MIVSDGFAHIKSALEDFAHRIEPILGPMETISTQTSFWKLRHCASSLHHHIPKGICTCCILWEFERESTDSNVCGNIAIRFRRFDRAGSQRAVSHGNRSHGPVAKCDLALLEDVLCFINAVSRRREFSFKT